MQKVLVVFAWLACAGVNVSAQNRATRGAGDSSVSGAQPAWVSRHDLTRAAGAVATIGLLSLADEDIAKATQRRSLQNKHALNNVADAVQVVGDPGALLLSTSLFVVGKLSHHKELANASRRSTEAIVLSGSITQLLKLSIGRARPVVSQDGNAFAFHLFHGSQPNFNSFPSGHTTAAFAAASVFSAEIRYAHPGATKFATPALYGLATAVGGARIYNERHWLTDVAAGALIGHFVGRKITSRVLRQRDH